MCYSQWRSKEAIGQPRSDEERAKIHFKLTDEEWNKLSQAEKQRLIDKLPPRGTGLENIHADFQTVLSNYKKHYGDEEGLKKF